MVHNSSEKEIWIGIGSLLLAHVLFVASIFVLSWIMELLGLYLIQPIASFAVFGIGVSQLMYALPLGLWFRRKRRLSAMKGVIIGVVITALLCGGCFVFALWLFSNLHG